MTAVLSLKFYGFANKKNGERGILNGCLSALSRHNLRMEINNKYEIKRKQQTVINQEQSKNNKIVKGLDYSKIDTIKQQQKSTKTRKNGVGAFSFVFDFKEQDKEEFNIEAHNELIKEYLSDIGLSDKFELLEFVWHMDEKSIHCHLLFSGYDQDKEKFSVNDFFSPKGESEPMRDKQGNTIYKKVANGKDRGKYILENGHKVPKLQAKRRNGAQWLQDEFSSYLKKTTLYIAIKKSLALCSNFQIGYGGDLMKKQRKLFITFVI